MSLSFPSWIQSLCYAIQIAREVLEIGAAALRPGITTDEIGKKI